MEEQKMKMPQQVTITNMLLAVIGIALCAITICVINFQQEEKRINQQNHDKLYSLLEKHAAHARSMHLKDEGRKLAFAWHFAEQVLGSELTATNPKKLLDHGSVGIDAYLSMKGDTDIIDGINAYSAQSKLYGDGMDAIVHRRTSPGDAQAAFLKNFSELIENKQNSESGGVK